ncbi:hypothetical protein E4U43_007223 [Claviceps pusilla]|uniref:Uncharacterized protein n=1 Tax=Claviceps pusilla TaxID=123648 RepID=A0A9P7NDD1_9HYPO|nr:hypothetical protein E4U43_007223 [Claviceps pusilla]
MPAHNVNLGEVIGHCRNGGSTLHFCPGQSQVPVGGQVGHPPPSGEIGHELIRMASSDVQKSKIEKSRCNGKYCHNLPSLPPELSHFVCPPCEIESFISCYARSGASAISSTSQQPAIDNATGQIRRKRLAKERVAHLHLTQPRRYEPQTRIGSVRPLPQAEPPWTTKFCLAQGMFNYPALDWTRPEQINDGLVGLISGAANNN